MYTYVDTYTFCKYKHFITCTLYMVNTQRGKYARTHIYIYIYAYIIYIHTYTHTHTHTHKFKTTYILDKCIHEQANNGTTTHHSKFPKVVSSTRQHVTLIGQKEGVVISRANLHTIGAKSTKQKHKRMHTYVQCQHTHASTLQRTQNPSNTYVQTQKHTHEVVPALCGSHSYPSTSARLWVPTVVST